MNENFFFFWMLPSRPSRPFAESMSERQPGFTMEAPSSLPRTKSLPSTGAYFSVALKPMVYFSESLMTGTSYAYSPN
jgi:hypothetical protein